MVWCDGLASQLLVSTISCKKFHHNKLVIPGGFVQFQGGQLENIERLACETARNEECRKIMIINLYIRIQT